MNEQIKLLAEQAIANVRFWNAGKESYEVDHDELKKFAELIIQECAMLVEGFEITHEVALDEYVDYEASSVLKKHFGVE